MRLRCISPCVSQQEKPPVLQVRARSTLNGWLQLQWEREFWSDQSYQRDRASLNADLCKANPWSSMGSAVSQVDAPFSQESSILVKTTSHNTHKVFIFTLSSNATIARQCMQCKNSCRLLQPWHISVTISKECYQICFVDILLEASLVKSVSYFRRPVWLHSWHFYATKEPRQG